jgi:hypothetical protein
LDSAASAANKTASEDAAPDQKPGLLDIASKRYRRFIYPEGQKKLLNRNEPKAIAQYIH